MKTELKNFFDAVEFEGPIMNSDNAVFLFTMKDGQEARKSLIKTGLFSGSEEFIRLRVSPAYSKMECNQYTIIKRNGESYDWQSGGGSNTLVSDQMYAKAALICDAVDEKLGLKLSDMRQEDFFKKFFKMKFTF